MRDRRTAEFRFETEASKILMDQNWRDGLIGDATYLRSLMILGYADNDARTELALLVLDKIELMKSRRKKAG